MPYLDLHHHLKNLEEHGLLRRITRLINKDTELHPLVRWQYRGLSEEERKAWLFENVTDAKGRKYDMPVVVGALAEILPSIFSAWVAKPPTRWTTVGKRLYPSPSRRSL